jgi:hypothetical protein
MDNGRTPTLEHLKPHPTEMKAGVLLTTHGRQSDHYLLSVTLGSDPQGLYPVILHFYDCEYTDVLGL